MTLPTSPPRWLRGPFAAAAVIVASLAMTALAWRIADRAERQRAQSAFDDEVAAVEQAIVVRMRAYEQVLLGGAALFAASHAVDRAEWRAYHRSLRLEQRFPGILGFGFTQWIEPRDRAAFVQQVRAEGYPDFDLRPEGEREVYTSIVYLEPLSGRNLRAFGYDMWSEAVRREAMSRARDSALPALSGRVTLVQETTTATQPGVLLYVPVYRSGAPIASVEQRRAALQGFVYSPFRAGDLMRGILGNPGGTVRVRLHDGNQALPERLLFDSAREAQPPPFGFQPAFTATRPLDVAGRSWTLVVHSQPGFGEVSRVPLLIALGGTLLSLATALVIARLWSRGEAAAAAAARAEEAVRHSEQRYRAVVEASPQAIVQADASGRITLVNAQAERLFGYARHELVGRPLEQLVPARSRDAHAALRAGFEARPAQRAMGAGRELRALHRSGREIAVEIALNPIDTVEGPQVLATIVDIGERLAATRRTETALREKTALLNEVHHRVKNNLQVVSSLLKLQSGRSAESAVRSALDESRGRVETMALIHQLLYEVEDFSGVELGQYLRRLVELIRESYRVDPARVAIRVEADELRLDLQRAIPCGLLVNELISNALKHAFPGGRRGMVWLTLRCDSGQAELCVADDGVGMPPGVDGAAAATLGLQLVRALAQQLGATLQRAPGPGTRVVLRFALSTAAPATQDQEARA